MTEREVSASSSVATRSGAGSSGSRSTAIFSNRPEEVPEAYQRYLLHGFREAWGFKGSPIRLRLRRRSGRAARP